MAKTPSLLRRLRVPKDEHQERKEREEQRRCYEIMLQQLVWAHERTEAAMEAGQHEAADSYSCSVAVWIDRLGELG